MAKFRRYDKWTLAVNCPHIGCPAMAGQECRINLNERFTLPYAHREREYAGKLARLRAEKEALEQDVPDLDS